MVWIAVSAFEAAWKCSIQRSWSPSCSHSKQWELETSASSWRGRFQGNHTTCLPCIRRIEGFGWLWRGRERCDLGYQGLGSIEEASNQYPSISRFASSRCTSCEFVQSGWSCLRNNGKELFHQWPSCTAAEYMFAISALAFLPRHWCSTREECPFYWVGSRGSRPSLLLGT